MTEQNDPRTDPVGTVRRHESGRTAVKVSMGDDTGKGGHVWVRLDENLESWWMHHADVRNWLHHIDVGNWPIAPSAATQTAEQAQPGREDVVKRLVEALLVADCVADPAELGETEEQFWRFMVGKAVMPIIDELLAAGSPVTETTTQATHWGREEDGGESAHNGADPDDCYVCRTAFLADELGRVQAVADRAKAKVDRALELCDAVDTVSALTSHREVAAEFRAVLSGVTSETEKRP